MSNIETKIERTHARHNVRTAINNGIRPTYYQADIMWANQLFYADCVTAFGEYHEKYKCIESVYKLKNERYKRLRFHIDGTLFNIPITPSFYVTTWEGNMEIGNSNMTVCLCINGKNSVIVK